MECDDPDRGIIKMSNTTAECKARLWKQFGSATNPAEWDGHYGGGTLSQRFLEFEHIIPPFRTEIVSRIAQLPVWAENAFAETAFAGGGLPTKMVSRLHVKIPQQRGIVVPLLYPVAVKFMRAAEEVSR
jgi:hypothetical protein